MKEKHLVVLIGPMGAGKTTIGKLLAQQLNFEFYDSDIEIEKSTGASINWIFEKEGESGFRKRETKMVEGLTQKSAIVLATGGGVVVTPENHDYLKRGLVIYLRADVEVQHQRIQKDKTRPLLQTENPKQRLRELFAIRDPIYQNLADMMVISDNLSPKKMVKKILACIEQLPYQELYVPKTPVIPTPNKVIYYTAK